MRPLNKDGYFCISGMRLNSYRYLGIKEGWMTKAWKVINNITLFRTTINDSREPVVLLLALGWILREKL